MNTPSPTPANVVEPDKTTIDVTLTFTTWHHGQFEQARAEIEKIYGKAPPLENLMHLCLCKASEEIVHDFTGALEEIVDSGVLTAPAAEPILTL